MQGWETAIDTYLSKDPSPRKLTHGKKSAREIVVDKKGRAP